MNYAEDVNYWKSSRTSPDSWIDKAKKEIEKVGGEILGEVFGNEAKTGRAAYMLAFAIGEDQFKLVWPVLPSAAGNEKAARIQAATALYHDVKASCVKAKFLGSRAAFFSALLLPNGQSAGEASTNELADYLPEITGRPMLTG